MKIELTQVTIRDLVDGYADNSATEEGIVGYGGRLNIRPKYQREFVYDEKKRNAAEIRNEADGAVFQAEKLMRDLGDKMSPEEKGRVNSKIDALKKAIESNNEAGMKDGKDDLMKTLQEFGARLYQNAGPSAGANPNPGTQGNTSSNNDSETVDAEFSDKG